MSAFGCKADVTFCGANVCFWPGADVSKVNIIQRSPAGVCANNFVEASERTGEELIMRALSFVILTTALFWPVAASAQLNVLISGGFSGAYEKLLPERSEERRVGKECRYGRAR